MVAQSDAAKGGSPAAEDAARAAEQGEERPPAPGIDITRPHVARMYDYYLGGKHNYAVDREAAEQALKLVPQGRIGARMNRWFLIETVRWLVREAGIRQILDIGSGLPTQQNVHEVAQAIDPNAKVVYVDNDPLVRVHAEALLATNPNTIFLTADLRDPNDLLNRPEIRSHLDFSQPIALLLVAVLHFIEDTQQAYDVVKVLCDALPSGSYLAISHGLIEEGQKEATQQASAVYRRANSGVYPRTREEILGFFTGLTPVGCGLVHISEWTPPGRPAGPTAGDNVVSLGDPAVLRSLPGMCGIARIDR
nr:MAG: hypothetical protein DIU60_24790 [Actinomycetota bacterium]